jgi:hypothetical protein
MRPGRHDEHLIRIGELSDGWSLMFTIGWAAVAAGFAAVWRASWQLGLPTWWLTERSNALGALWVLVPFIPPAALIIAAARRARFLPWWGLAMSGVLGAVALFDLDRARGLALAGAAAALTGALVSVASLAGMYRSASVAR